MPNKFGYEEMLKIGRPLSLDEHQLDELANSMAPRENEKQIPAGYVYLGQFIDHDVTSEQRLDGKPNDPFGAPIKASDLVNHRTPFLNLETIYGFETTRHGEPTRSDLLNPGSESILRLGDTVAGRFVKKEFKEKDLYRPDAKKPCALLVDKRNDENLAVAQTHVMFVRFHNEVVRRVVQGDEKDPKTFEEARKIVIQHYQWIVLHDFLRKVLKHSVLDDVLTSGNRFYFPNSKYPALPFEFTVGAFRIGHSMVSSTYNWNLLFNNDPTSVDQAGFANLMALRRFTGPCGMGGFKRLPSDWLINWFWFHDVGDEQGEKLNLAEKIDARLASLTMPGTSYERHLSLAARDLFRNKTNLLPSGQAVAEVIHGTKSRVLKPDQIRNLLPRDLGFTFDRETPLWFYLLAEAEIEERGETFGEVGSRIMAEVFVELIKLSEYSILLDGFRPREEWSDALGRFGMPDVIQFVTDRKAEEIDPISSAELDRNEILKLRLLLKQKRSEQINAENEQTEKCGDC